MWKQKKYSKQNENIPLLQLLQCKEHIQIISNHNKTNVEKNIQITCNHSKTNVKKNHSVNKMTTLPSIHIHFILHYITLTSYYIVKNIFKSQAITAS